jgi:hypothetical protein
MFEKYSKRSFKIKFEKQSSFIESKTVINGAKVLKKINFKENLQEYFNFYM